MVFALPEGLDMHEDEGSSEEKREVLARLIEIRFGPLRPNVKERLADWPADRLDELFEGCLQASTLRELGLED